MHTFEMFPRFPEDIRYEIWKLAASEPRHVSVTFSLRPAHTVPENAELCSKLFEVHTETPVPPILHASREARQVGLKAYHKCFRQFGAENDSEDDCIIYLNVPVDRIFLKLPAIAPELLHGAVRLLVSSPLLFRAPPKRCLSAPPSRLPLIGLYSRGAPRNSTYLVIQPVGCNKTVEEARVELTEMADHWLFFEMQMMVDWETAWGVILVTVSIRILHSVLKPFNICHISNDSPSSVV